MVRGGKTGKRGGGEISQRRRTVSAAGSDGAFRELMNAASQAQMRSRASTRRTDARGWVLRQRRYRPFDKRTVSVERHPRELHVGQRVQRNRSGPRSVMSAAPVSRGGDAGRWTDCGVEEDRREEGGVEHPPQCAGVNRRHPLGRGLETHFTV